MASLKASNHIIRLSAYHNLRQSHEGPILARTRPVLFSIIWDGQSSVSRLVQMSRKDTSQTGRNHSPASSRKAHLFVESPATSSKTIL